MGIDTGIEWADHTANFWEGCTQISPACDHCYAKTRAERYGTVEWNGPPRRVMAGFKVVRAAQRIAEQTGVKQFVFVNSLSDFFDNQADPQWRAEALHAMLAARGCVFLLLTKRIGNVEAMMQATGLDWARDLPNVWQGITVINQAEADRDIPKLLAAKTALNIPRVFLSIEPMLGPIDLTPEADSLYRRLSNWYGPDGFDPTGMQPEKTRMGGYFPRVDWVICGGESGQGARPMHPDWARSLRDQCASAGVPWMFKQWGDYAPCEIKPPGWDWRAHHSVVLSDGTHLTGEDVLDHPEDAGAEIIRKFGKHAAGRLLDGVEHNGRPQP